MSIDIEEMINEGIEFCNTRTGEHFKAYGMTFENKKTTILLEPVLAEEQE